MSHGVEVVSLFYQDEANAFIDEDGRFLSADSFHIISPGRFEYLKKCGGAEYVNGDKPGTVYELIFTTYDEDDGRPAYYYDRNRNRFSDDGGYDILNIFGIVSPNMIYLFKTKKEDMLVYGTSGQLIELIYLDQEIDF
jgi:hypothetical protein